MAKQNGFDVSLSEALGKLTPGDETHTASTALLDQYRDELRKVATMPNNMKARTQHLDRLDNWLLDELAQLSDTEHDEQPGQEQPGQEQPGEQPAAVAPQPSEPPPDRPAPNTGRKRPKPQ